jgi:hypothetical protein
MTTHTTEDSYAAAKAKAEHDLKKVQQRTAAIVVFSIAYHCVFALIAVGKVVQNQGREGDAYGLVFMSGVLALLMTCGIRGILGHRILSPIWTPLALSPPVIAAIWLL